MSAPTDHNQPDSSRPNGEFVNTPTADHDPQPMNHPYSTPVNGTESESVTGPHGVVFHPFTATRPEDLPTQRGTTRPTEDTVIDGAVLDADGVPLPVDPPSPTGRSWWESQRGAKAREVIPAWARSRAELADRAKWMARYTGHTAAFHAVRCPQYAAVLALRGAARCRPGHRPHVAVGL